MKSYLLLQQPGRSCWAWCIANFFLLCFAGLLIGAPASKPNPLIWEQGDGYRRAKLNVPSDGKPGFTLMTPERTGITWSNTLSLARVRERQNLMNGAGVAAGDFDGDGWPDLYFCNKEGANALYRNLGDWKFVEVTGTAGVACTNQSSTGTTFADVNGDGQLDLLVNSFTGPNSCFLNLGGGRFTNVTESAGLVSKGGATSTALSDIEGTGSLDLYNAYFGIESALRDGATVGIRMVDGKMVLGGALCAAYSDRQQSHVRVGRTLCAVSQRRRGPFFTSQMGFLFSG